MPSSPVATDLPSAIAPVPHPPGPVRRRDARPLLAAVMVLSLLVLLVFARASWQSTQRDAALSLQRLAQLNAGAFAIVLRDAERLEQAAAKRLSREPLPQAGLEAMLREELALRFSGDEIAEFFEADTRRLLASSAEAREPPAGLGEQFSRVTASHTAVVGWGYRRGERWWLPVIYRTGSGDWLVVSVPIEKIFAQWGTARDTESPQGPVGLRGPDDRILLRQPFTPAMLGADASQSASAREIAAAVSAGRTAGSVRALATETDGSERLIGWALVPGTGLRTLVALDVGEVNAAWWRHSGVFVLTLAALLVATFSVGGQAFRRLLAARRGAEQAEAAQRQAHLLVEQALDASRDTTWQLTADGQWRFAADLGVLVDARPAQPGDERRTLAWLLTRLDDRERQGLSSAVAALDGEGARLYHPFVVPLDKGQRAHYVLKGRRVAAAGAPQGVVAVGTLRDVSRVVQAHSALALTAATLQRMCALARIGPWSVDPRSLRLDMSTEARRIYGLDADEPVAPWLSFISSTGEHQARLESRRQRLLHTGQGYDEVVPLATEGQQTARWVRSVAEARLEDGRVVAIDGAVQEVTDLVLARRALDEASWRARQLAAAVTASSQLVLFTDAERRITWCNEAFSRRTGWRLDEILGRHPGPLLQREDMPAALREHMSRALDERRSYRVERVPNYTRDGERYWIDQDVQPIIDEHGVLQGYVSVQTDVSHDIAREAQLRETRDRFERAAQGAHIGVWEHWFSNDSRQWNSVMYELWGLPVNDPQLHSSRFTELMHPEDIPTMGADWQRALLDPTVFEWRGEFRVRARLPAPDGSTAWRWMRLVATLERDEAGVALRGVGTMVEFTAERELHSEQAARMAAEARSQATKAFLSRMSHELRTPLNAVIGYAQLMRAEAEGGDLRLHRIERAGWHLLSLIDDILDLTRIEAGTMRVELRQVALLPLLVEVGEFLGPLSERHGVTLVIEPTELAVVADPTRLRQALLNLVSNAIKYNRPQGQVRVAAGGRGERVDIRIADTGPGMSGQQIQRLFKPFERLGREGSSIEGTGLGLVITQALVQLMDGRVEVASTPGEGSEFTISLRVASGAERAPVLVAPPPPAAPPPLRRVLCVEDNEVNALMFTEALRHLRPHWRCEVADSIAQARMALVRGRFDLVFLDLHLADGEGLAVLGHGPGQVDPATAVLLSADLSDQARRQAQRHGVERRLGKPFRLGDLDSLLQQMEQGLAEPQEP